MSNVIKFPDDYYRDMHVESLRVVKALLGDDFDEGRVGSTSIADDPLLQMQLAKIGIEALLIQEAAKHAMSDPHKCLKALPEYPVLEHLRDLRHAVAYQACHTIHTSFISESDIQSEFFDNLDEFLPGATIANEMKSKGGNIPDGFINWRGAVCVVEVKRHVFDKRALKQIRRYMQAYDAPYGVAVAPKYSCDLPEDVHFVKVDCRGNT